MNHHVSWVIEMQVQQGQEVAFRTLMSEMVSNTVAKEPGTLSYEWYVTPDGRQCHVRETYANSDAAMAHLQTFTTRYFERFFGAVTPTRCCVYGAPSAEVRAVMDGLNPEYLGFAAGIMR